MSQLRGTMNIKFSEKYLEVLKKYLLFLKSKPTKEVLFFKGVDKIYISHMDASTGLWVNISTSSDHITFDKDEVALSNLDEFLKYTNVIKYPKDANSSLSYNQVKNSSGDLVLDILYLQGKKGKYFLPLGNTSCFTTGYDRKIPTERDKDITLLKAKMYLDTETISSYIESLKLMETPRVFGLGIFDDQITFYLKGKTSQQYEDKIESTKSQVFDSYTTRDKTNSNGGCKLFPSELLNCLESFGVPFDIEMRTVTRDNGVVINTLKAYGTIKEENLPDIDIVIGAMENISNSVSGIFDIMLLSI